MHDERLFKYKFIYFYSIVFLFGWSLYYGFHIGNILFKGFRLDEELGLLKMLIYILFFTPFLFSILSLINVFKESYKSIRYFNIVILLIITTTFVSSYLNHTYKKPYFIVALLFYLLILFFSAFLINFYKHTSK